MYVFKNQSNDEKLLPANNGQPKKRGTVSNIG